MNTFIINPTTFKIVGVSGVKNFDLGQNIGVKKAEDLVNLTNVQMTKLYNEITGEEKSVFKTSKAQSAEKVMAVLNLMDLTKLVKLDATEEAAIVKQADGIKTRKVRDSKLQRMAAAFREHRGEKNRAYSIAQLMEKCGTSEKITHQYISILRAKNDRFKLNIVKNKEANTFVLA